MEEGICDVLTAGEGRVRQTEGTAEQRQVQRRMTPNAEQRSSQHTSADGVVERCVTHFWAPSWRFPACFRLPSVGLLPALTAGLGCCFPVLGTVIPLEVPSALDPPFTIAVAIIKTGQGWCPDGQPPDQERETADIYLSYVSVWCQGSSLKGCKICEMLRKTTGAN